MEGTDSTNWAVAWICCFMSFVLLGVARLSGLLFVVVMENYGVNRSQASLPFVLCYTVRNIAGPLIGYLGRRLGLRTVCLLGCILSVVGIGLCFFAEEVITVTVLWGGVFGLGLGLGTVLIPEILREHFSKDIAKANGIAFGGECLAGFVLPVLLETSLKTYGTQGTFLILSGLVLNSVPAVLLLKKPRRVLNTSSGSEKKSNAQRNFSKIICPCESQNGKINESTSQNIKISTNTNNFNKLRNSSDNTESLLNNVKDARKNTVTRPSSEAGITGHWSTSSGETSSQILSAKKEELKLCETQSQQSFHECYKSSRKGKLKRDIVLCERESYDSVQKTNVLNSRYSKSCGYLNMYADECSFSSKQMHQSCIHFGTLNGSSKESTGADDQITKYFSITPSNTLHYYQCPFSSQQGNSSGETTITDASLRKNKNNAAAKSFTVFLDLTFILILFIQSSFIYIVTTVLTIVVDFSKDIGVEDHQQIYIVMGMSIADMIGRFSLGFVTDSGYMTNTAFSSSGFAIMGFLLLVSVWLRGFALLMIVMFLFGILLGGLLIVFPGIVADYVEEDNITMALASRLSLYGPLSLTQSSLIGFFRGSLGSYDGVFYILMVSCFLCSVLTVLTPVAAKRRNQNKHKSLSTETDSLLKK